MLRRIALCATILAGAALAPAPAQAQIMGNYAFKPPAKVQEEMEKDRVPALFFFTMEYDAPAQSISWNFTQPQIIDMLNRYNFAACKIAIADQKSTRPWGSYQKLADEFGVTPATTLVVVSYDRKVLGLLSQVLKRDEFIVYLRQRGQENKARIEASDQANNDCTQIEEWLEHKPPKLADANRRLISVLKKEKAIAAKVFERAKEIDGKLEAACNERMSEAKALLEGGKPAEAKPILDDVVNGATRFADCLKEAKELHKKAASAKPTAGTRKG
ncbi:MAG TPA: hypothetical protein VHF22_06380 [Planctomycetota bacterium]|nr:hypothetical protein [Planctomycetota bacterium]